MKQVITTERVPIKLWLDDIESGALAQAKNTANLPFTFKHVAIMPDSHQGYGMPIGGVLATKGVVIPNAVGVDIGCGMCAVRTSLININREELNLVREDIKKLIPVGFAHRSTIQNQDLMPDWEYIDDKRWIVSQQYEKALFQLGTLGGGNHFIEIQKDSNGYIWIMIHSGSRNIGYKVAAHYNKLAEELNSFWYSEVQKDKELAFLPTNSDAAKHYFREMQFCIDFALANRTVIVNDIKQILTSAFDYIIFDDPINIAHNYARWEHHFNNNVVVHRKGATSAKEDELGIIPGSQGTKSYIVKGLGNTESFTSCSHGAGRAMGRNEAIKKLDLAHELHILDSQDILHSITTTKDLDEASSAYKDIDVVMENQKDLVKIVTELTPLAVIKG